MVIKIIKNNCEGVSWRIEINKIYGENEINEFD